MNTNSHSTLILSIAGECATVVLSRPQVKNAMNETMRAELLTVIKELEANDAVRIVVLTGAGNCFSAGQDLAGINPDVSTQQLLECEYRPIIAGIRQSRKIYVCAIDGACAGAAVSIALACDLVAMSRRSFLYLAFAKLGLMPDAGATWLLGRALGYHRSFALFALGGTLDAQDALAAGLANAVFPEQTFDTDLTHWLQPLLSGSQDAYVAIKQTLNAFDDDTLGKAMAMEAHLQQTLSDSDFFKRCLSRFNGPEG